VAPPCQRVFESLGVLKAIKERRYTRTKAPALVFEVDSILQLVVFRPLVSAEVIKETQIYAAMCKMVVLVKFIAISNLRKN